MKRDMLLVSSILHSVQQEDDVNVDFVKKFYK